VAVLLFLFSTTATVSRHTELTVHSPGLNSPKLFLHLSDMPAFTKAVSSLSKAELLSAAAAFHFDATGSVNDLRADGGHHPTRARVGQNIWNTR
jgi:hypothetical protein